MKMSCVLTDNIQRGYSLHESLARGESSYMKGARPHFCLLISIQKGRLSAQHNSLPPHSLFRCLLPRSESCILSVFKISTKLQALTLITHPCIPVLCLTSQSTQSGVKASVCPNKTTEYRSAVCIQS